MKTKLWIGAWLLMCIVSVSLLVVYQVEKDQETLQPVYPFELAEQAKLKIANRELQLPLSGQHKIANETFDIDIKRIRDDWVEEKTVSKYVVKIALKTKRNQNAKLFQFGLVDLSPKDAQGEMLLISDHQL